MELLDNKREFNVFIGIHESNLSSLIFCILALKYNQNKNDRYRCICIEGILHLINILLIDKFQ